MVHVFLCVMKSHLETASDAWREGMICVADRL